jgi:hypothetical protein
VIAFATLAANNDTANKTKEPTMYFFKFESIQTIFFLLGFLKLEGRKLSWKIINPSQAHHSDIIGKEWQSVLYLTQKIQLALLLLFRKNIG